MDEVFYYMNAGGPPIGPVTRESLEALRASRVIINDTLVRAGDHARWVPYSEWVLNHSTSDGNHRPESTRGRAATNTKGSNGRGVLGFVPAVVAGLVGSHLSRLFHGTPIASALLTGLSFMVGSLIGIFLYALALEAINRTVERRGTAAIVTSFGLSAAFLAILVAVPDPIAGYTSSQATPAPRVAVAPVPAGTVTSPVSSLKTQSATAAFGGQLSVSAAPRILRAENAAAAAGIADAQRGDYKAAFANLKPLADQGNATAEFNIGVMYEHGFGVTQNYTQAEKWYRLAASAGVGQAQYNLGILYDTGKRRAT